MLRYDSDADALSVQRQVVCDRCGLRRLTHHPLARIHHCCSAPPAGPGTELHNLVAELGITPTATCGCEAMRRQMNDWGPAGCREHREEILAHLRTAYDEASVATKMKAGVLVLAKWLPLTLEGLLDEAIRRAE